MHFTQDDDDDANSEYYPTQPSNTSTEQSSSMSSVISRTSPSFGTATAAVASLAAATAAAAKAAGLDTQHPSPSATEAREHEKHRYGRNSSSGGTVPSSATAAASSGTEDSSTSFASGLHCRANPLPLDEHGNVVSGMMVTKLVIQGPVDPDFGSLSRDLGSGAGSPSVNFASSTCSTPVGGGTAIDALARARRMSFGQHMGSLVRKVGDLADTLVERLTGEGGGADDGGSNRSPSLLSIRTSLEGGNTYINPGGSMSPSPISPTVSNVGQLSTALFGMGLRSDSEEGGSGEMPGGEDSAGSSGNGSNMTLPPPPTGLQRRSSLVNSNIGTLPPLQENSVMCEEDLERVSGNLARCGSLRPTNSGETAMPTSGTSGTHTPCLATPPGGGIGDRALGSSPPSSFSQISAPVQLANGTWTQHPQSLHGGQRVTGSGGGAAGWTHERPPLSGAGVPRAGTGLGESSISGGGAGQAGDGGSSTGFPQRLGQSVKRRLEVLAGGMGGGPGDMSKLCLQGEDIANI